MCTRVAVSVSTLVSAKFYQCRCQGCGIAKLFRDSDSDSTVRDSNSDSDSIFESQNLSTPKFEMSTPNLKVLAILSTPKNFTNVHPWSEAQTNRHVPETEFQRGIILDFEIFVGCKFEDIMTRKISAKIFLPFYSFFLLRHHE